MELRFWYSGKIGFTYVCGWCFGATLDEAGACALGYEAKSGRRSGPVQLFLQADTGPDAGLSVAWAPPDPAKPQRVEVPADSAAGRPALTLFAWARHAFTGGVFVGADPTGILWQCSMRADGSPDVEAVRTPDVEASLARAWQDAARIFLVMAHGHELGATAAVLRDAVRPARTVQPAAA